LEPIGNPADNSKAPVIYPRRGFFHMTKGQRAVAMNYQTARDRNLRKSKAVADKVVAL